MVVLDGIGMHDGWDWAIGAIIMLLAWGTILWGGLYLWGRARSGDSAGEHAAEILRRRFARGEIAQTEFEDRLAQLRRSERR